MDEEEEGLKGHMRSGYTRGITILNTSTELQMEGEGRMLYYILRRME
jgi:hypothetical protein